MLFHSPIRSISTCKIIAAGGLNHCESLDTGRERCRCYWKLRGSQHFVSQFDSAMRLASLEFQARLLPRACGHSKHRLFVGQLSTPPKVEHYVSPKLQAEHRHPILPSTLSVGRFFLEPGWQCVAASRFVSGCWLWELRHREQGLEALCRSHSIQKSSPCLASLTLRRVESVAKRDLEVAMAAAVCLPIRQQVLDYSVYSESAHLDGSVSSSMLIAGVEHMTYPPSQSASLAWTVTLPWVFPVQRASLD